MSAQIKDHLLDWLRNAHAMENQREILLKGQYDNFKDYPSIRETLQIHLNMSRNHQLAIHDCIKKLGGDISTVKDWAGKIVATGQNIAGMTVSDEIVKSTMTLYSFTHIAISSYTVLVSAADFFGEKETKSICETILEEESRVSRWLLDKLPELTQKFLRTTVMY